MQGQRAIKSFIAGVAASLLASVPAWANSSRSEAGSATRGGAISPPTAAQPRPLVAPRIEPRLVPPPPLSQDPPALQGGKAAPPEGYGGAMSRCESLADVERRNRCRDTLSRETPVRPPR
jgi:hypothetical protein